MNKIVIFILGIFLIAILVSCGFKSTENRLQKVGMLIDGDIEGSAWNQKGYEGLVSIGEKYDVDVLYRTNIISEQEVTAAVETMVKKDVNLIFGHSNIYGKYFAELSGDYPDTHFIYFNGSYYKDNLSSFNFDSHAMGFFGGMVASKMTQTNEIGVIAAYEWQPEVEGFYEGVKYQNENVNVHIKFINNWNDPQLANDIYEMMRTNDVDVFYPTGDYYSQEIIKRASKDDVYTIGYVLDQMEVGPNSVLTSTVQHVDNLYEIAIDRFQSNELRGGVYSFDFQDEAISLGVFNSIVPAEFQSDVELLIDEYIKTNALPNHNK